MTRIVIIGGGIIGATIAYELSAIKGLEITLIEQNQPASGSTGAALGVLMGSLSHKVRGRAWQLREISLNRYETLIPELEALTSRAIPFNRQGIVMLGLTQDELKRWETLATTRNNQGWNLERWTTEQLAERCPQIQGHQILGAIYAPRDRQVNPVLLTQALVAGALIRGVDLYFGQNVQKFTSIPSDDSNKGHCVQVHTVDRTFMTDWVIVAGGIGSTQLATALAQSVEMQPVLGQAIHLKLPQPLGFPEFQPVITGDDVHIVPLGRGEYWVGATVEFPDEKGLVEAAATLLEGVKRKAIAFCPELIQGEILRTWSGVRPRPVGQSAPVIKLLDDYDNVLLATGHYRNGVLLAPATAQAIAQMIAV